jgi:hypothetical protein
VVVYASHKGEQDVLIEVGAAMGRLLRRTLVRLGIEFSKKNDFT